jgi:glycosyltransferase involved in cell wall biosynthesis
MLMWSFPQQVVCGGDRRGALKMYRGLTVIAIVPVFNEAAKIGKVVARMPREIVDEVLVVDDGSTDDSAEVARSSGAQVISMGATPGVGAALRTGYEYAVQGGYDVTVTVAGNNKDSPEEIPLLLDPIAEDRADFVQGSRFLKRGATLARSRRIGRLPRACIRCSFRWSHDGGSLNQPTAFARCVHPFFPILGSICRKHGCDNMNWNRTCICAASSLATVAWKCRSQRFIRPNRWARQR